MKDNQKPLAYAAVALGVLTFGSCCCVSGALGAYTNIPDPGNEPPEEVRALYEEHVEDLRYVAGTTRCDNTSRMIAAVLLADRPALVTASRLCYNDHPDSYVLNGPAASCSGGVAAGDPWYPERVQSDGPADEVNTVRWSGLPDGSYCLSVDVDGFREELAPDADSESMVVVLHTPPPSM